MRGLFTCGVLDVFMENGIVFDGAAGISAGATFGCNYKSRQIGRALRYNLRFSRDPRYCSLQSLLKTGDLYGAEFCYKTIPDELDPFDREAFRTNPMAFYIGATETATGKTRYHLCTDGGERDILWMRASASMPMVSRPVEIGSRTYLDGGITDAVPFLSMEGQGFDRNVMVLTQPRGYRKKPAKLPGVMKLLLRKMPAISRAMQERPAMYNGQMEDIEKREAAGQSLVIRPPRDLGIGRTEKDPEKLRQVYEIGRKTGEEALPKVRSFLGQ